MFERTIRLIRIAPDVFVNPLDIISVSWLENVNENFRGTVIQLKHAEKLLINRVTPREVMDRLKTLPEVSVK